MTYSYTSPTTCNAGLLGPTLAEICSASTFVVFMSILDSFIRTDEKISGICDRVDPVKMPDDVYDFVVIGSGAAGAVVASRLSEDSDLKILLLEAGPDEPAGSEIPGFALKFLKTDLDWKWTTTNELHACLSTNGSCSWPAGKNLGGSTVHSGNMYFRGSQKDYDNWAELGNEGWTWKDVEEYFLFSEDNGEIERVGTEHHTTGGLLPVSRYPYIPPFDESILAAAEEIGYGVSEDLNGNVTTGFSYAQSVSREGVKYSSASAYLRPIRNRTNLHVSLNSFVTRVVIEDDTAVAVEYYKDDELRRVNVTREVVISAGTIMSPHILLHSGIGPKEHLEEVGIDVVKDLPGVGENLHNHVSYGLTFTIDEPDTYENNWAAAAEYVAFQTGPMSCIGLATVVGLLASNETDSDHPDIQIFGSGSTAACAPGEIDALRSAGLRTVTIVATYTQPKSRGKITLASNDPLEYPVMWGNYLDDSRDVEGLLRGIHAVLDLAETEALQSHNLTMSVTEISACSDHTFASDEYWLCAMQQNTIPANHQVGSCKMGPSTDSLAVVDPELKVHGINGLRVADASIMPQITSASPAAATFMIGERAAAFIKNDLAL